MVSVRPPLTLFFGRHAPGLILLTIAAAIRLSLIHTARFTDDEARFYAIVRDLVLGRSFPWVGPPLTGGAAGHPGGLFYYMMALSQLAAPTPEAANALVAVLGALSVWLFWDALRPIDAWGAAVAGLMMAVSPWSVFYADRIWNSNVVGFPVALAFWAAVRVRQVPRSRWIALLALASLVMPQIHMSAPVVWVALVVLVGWRRVNLHWLTLGMLAGATTYTPYLASELASNFENTRTLFRETVADRAHPPYEVPVYLARFLTLDVAYHQLGGHSVPVSDPELVAALVGGSPGRPFHPLRLAAWLVSVVVAAVAIGAAARSPAWAPFGRAVLAGAVADAALLGWTHKTFFPHYLQPLLPFLFAAYAALPRRPWVVALLAIQVLGSLDAVYSISFQIDARNGLAVHRRVIERLLPEQRVRLEQGFHGRIGNYKVLAFYNYGDRLRFLEPGPPPDYLLLDDHQPLPAAPRLIPVETIPPVTLYRVAP